MLQFRNIDLFSGGQRVIHADHQGALVVNNLVDINIMCGDWEHDNANINHIPNKRVYNSMRTLLMQVDGDLWIFLMNVNKQWDKIQAHNFQWDTDRN